MKNKQWTIKNIYEVRKAVVKELDRATASTDAREKAKIVLRRILENSGDLSSVGLLRSYTYIMSALVHHERHGFLSDAQIRSLSEDATRILMLQGIDRERSKMAFLYGDIHLILSQIHRKNGRAWLALWEQQTSLRHSENAPTNGPGPQLISTAIRAIRVGQARLAIDSFRNALGYSLIPTQRQRAGVGLVNALRLAGRLRESGEEASRLLGEDTFDERSKIELGWEKDLRTIMAGGDMIPIFQKLYRQSPWFRGSYLLDAFLWSRAVGNRRFMSRIPSIKRLARRRELNIKPSDLIVQSCLTIEDCQDSQLDFFLRFRNLGKIIDSRRKLVTIEKEMLLLAAATRWLYRSKQTLAAKVVLGEYTGLSFRLTEGRTPDVLGAVADICLRLEVPIGGTPIR